MRKTLRGRILSAIFSASGRWLEPLPRAILSALLIADALCPAAFAQDSQTVLPPVSQDQIDLLAARVGEHIRNSKSDPSYPKLLVIDFSNASDGQFSELGTYLADTLSRELSTQADGFGVQDRASLRTYMRENWMVLPDLQNKDLCLALARAMGSTGVVRGDLQEDPDHKLLLTLQLEGFGPAWSTGALIPLTDQMQTLLRKPAAFFARAPDALPREPGVFRAGLDGAGVPVCVRCPTPAFTNLARIAKYQGTITLSLIVRTDGSADSIVVLRGAPFELTKQAIDAVQKWQFKPAEKDGKPVAVRAPVEITFRLY